MATNYVKFLRGSTKAYQAKVNAGTIDNNTLYFVYEANDSKTGQLYLGSKLLCDAKSEITNSEIGQLKDIVIEAVGDKQILVYDAVTGTWKNQSLDAVVGVMVGASATVAGASGLVPAPAAGDESKFLRGDGTWANEFITSVDTTHLTVTDGKLALTADDAKKLAKLVIDQDDKIAVSDTVSADNVVGLTTAIDKEIEAKVGTISNLIDTRTDEEKAVEGSTAPSMVQTINALYQILTWEELPEVQEETGT